MSLLDGFQGLLGTSIEDPRTMATLQLAQGLLGQGGGMQRLVGGLQGYGGVMAQSRREEEEKKRRALQEQLLQAQIGETRAQAQQREAAAQEALRKAEEQARVQALLAGALSPVRGIEANAASGVTGPRPEALAAVGQRRQIDPQALIGGGVSPDLVKALMESPNYGRPKVARTIERRGPDGRPATIQLDEFGNEVGRDMPKAVELKTMDLGGGFQAYDPFALTPGQRFNRTNSPDALLSAGTTRRGQDMTDARARELAALRAQELADIRQGKKDDREASVKVGQSTVDGVIASLRDQYDKLDTAGGITNPEKGVFDNLTAGVQSSGPGQAAGRLFGTQNQSARNTIAQQRPVLLQAIMKATGMSAKQMDSNAELKLYLATATDPTLDVAANRRALDMLEKLYGSGAGNAPLAPKAPKPAPTLRWNPRTNSFDMIGG